MQIIGFVDCNSDSDASKLPFVLCSRVRDLMRAGVMKEADKPLWYDVMAAFPPRDEPTYHREYTHDFLPQILYEEDKLRS